MPEESGFQLGLSGAENYEASWVRAQMAQCARDLVDTAEIAAGDRVLDIACGTGAVTREAVLQCGSAGRVTGTDVSGPMLEEARKFARRAGLPDIDWVECDAADMPFEDNSFDVILCQQGLQFMPDKPAALHEMHRVLTPGGRLVLSVWKRKSPIGDAFSEVLDRHFGAGTTAPWDAVYSLGDRSVLKELALGAGFRDPHVTFDFKFCRHPDPAAFIQGALAGSPLAETIAGLDDTVRNEIVAEIVTALGDNFDDGGLAVPAACHTVSARK